MKEKQSRPAKEGTRGSAVQESDVGATRHPPAGALCAHFLASQLLSFRPSYTLRNPKP